MAEWWVFGAMKCVPKFRTRINNRPRLVVTGSPCMWCTTTERSAKPVLHGHGLFCERRRNESLARRSGRAQRTSGSPRTLATTIPGWSRSITGIWHRATSRRRAFQSALLGIRDKSTGIIREPEFASLRPRLYRVSIFHVPGALHSAAPFFVVAAEPIAG